MGDTTSTTDGQQTGTQQQTGANPDGQQQTTQQTGQQSAQDGQQQTQQAAHQQTGDQGGAGGKDQILADLATERDKRQALEQQLQQAQQTQQSQLDAIAKALGLKGDEPPDPDKLASQLTSEQAEKRDAKVQLAVYRAATANGANPDALLDSQSFLTSVKDVDPADQDKVATAIKAAVEKNPNLAAQRVTPGVRDAAQGSNAQAGGTTVNDLIRAAAGR